MESLDDPSSPLDRNMARRLRTLRTEHGWSLDTLAARSGVSRASLSRLESGEVSPTAAVLGRLCAAHGLTLSRLMQMVEDDFRPHLPRAAQPLWVDPETGFRRRTVSPPSTALSGEVVEGELPAATTIDYDAPPRPGLEHHLLLIDGRLTLTLGDRARLLAPGDCLRYRLYSASAFATPADSGARYLLFML